MIFDFNLSESIPNLSALQEVSRGITVRVANNFLNTKPNSLPEQKRVCSHSHAETGGGFLELKKIFWVICLSRVIP